MKFKSNNCAIILLLAGIGLSALGQGLLTEEFNNSASNRWLNKKVISSRVLDDMESLAHWTAFTTGAPEVVDARTAQKATDRGNSVTEITFSREHSREGRQSLRMRMPTRLEVPGPKNGRGWGSAGVRRQFEGEDWSGFNRISLWIYPDCPGFGVVSLELRLYNDGMEKLPALFGQEGETTLVLRNHEWNHVVWEIGNVARDKITRLEISSLMSGNEPEATNVMTYDFDHLELQQVDPDYVEGWGVWPERIAYSHTGYQSGAAKNAIASGLNARSFRLIDQATRKTVLSKPIQTVRTHLGVFQVMDFSEVRQSGYFIIQAGDSDTRPFRIDLNVWRQTLLKELNFLYAERCGAAIPGVHGVCHRDWTTLHGDKRIVINGGWHDAGDLTQGLGNTGEIVYSLFSLAERLHARGEDPELYARVLEEARWGLDWVLKTSFGDGFRNQGSVNSRWTDGILGTSDDITSTARNSPMGNFTAAAAEAIAARVIGESDARLASYSLRMAEADWHFACEGMSGTNTVTSKQLWRGTFDSDNVEHEIASVGVLASVDLWQVTRNQRYADKAIELARIILASQERMRPNWEIPLFGFFYTGPTKDRILHYCHRGREQAPILALTRLCDAFPDHPDWMKWYSAVVLHSEYLKAAAKYTEPYGMMPASIYQAEEYQTAPESRRESFRKQVLNGISLGKGHYLRLFPVWLDYRGNFGTILPLAQALINAAHLRGDLDATTLAQHQAEWVVGRNPFSQSTMYGEGYDFAPLYAPFPGNIVGALPVGLQTRGDKDVPYWPAQSTWTYKEVWVHPVARWIWLMRDLAGPALVEGQADAPIQFIPEGQGPNQVITGNSINGRFKALLPEGKYVVHCNGEEETRTFLPTGVYHLDLRPGRALDFDISTDFSKDGEVRIRLRARGDGTHRFSIRTDNLTVLDPQKELNLKKGTAGTLEWSGRIISAETPWVALAFADENLATRKELTGAAWAHADTTNTPAVADSPHVASASEPIPRSDTNSLAAHEQLLRKAKQGGIDIFFVGDSITRRWGAADPQYQQLLENWKTNFFGWNAANFGWGGDRIENILWRLQNGELDGANPKVIVLLAGINNVGTEAGGPEKISDISRGLRAIVDVCQTKAPQATLILTGIFPRNDNPAVLPTINQINLNLAHLAEGKKVRYLNINDKLADSNGRLFPGMVNPDKLHPTLKAYQVWADSLKPIFTELLGPPARVDHAPPPTGDPSAMR